MLLTVDVGNTNIVLGVFSGASLITSLRLYTNKDKTADQYAAELRELLSLSGTDIREIKKAIISSVVPPLTRALSMAIKRLTGISPRIVTAEGITDIIIDIDTPAALGADLICTAVGAVQKYTLPVIVFDLGTATKITAIDQNRRLMGGSIMPGVAISADALSARAAMLPLVELTAPERLIGRGTVDSMMSGIIYGTASMMDGMFARYKEEMGENLTAVATGGLSAVVVPYCKSGIILDEHLLSDGLCYLAEKG